MKLGINLKKKSALFVGLLFTMFAYSQTYATFPFSDDLSSGSLPASVSWSQTGAVGNAAVTNASGGWPQFGTCPSGKCPNVGVSAGNGLMLYNTSNPAGGNNQINLDFHFNLSAVPNAEFQFAVVDYGSGSFDTIAVHVSDDGGSTFKYSQRIALNQAPHNDGVWNELTFNITSMLTAKGLSTTSSTVVFRMAAMMQRKGNPAAPKAVWNDQAIYFDNFKATQLATLPVELISFSGKQTGEGRLLNWVTASEVNNSHFDIQRSIDGVVWYTLGQIAGKGTSVDESHYGFLDADEVNGPVYYRLKQVDYNGDYAYSETISFNNKKSFSVTVLNNGAEPKVQFEKMNTSTIVELYSMTGQLIYQEASGNVGNVLDLNFLSSGRYLLMVKSESSQEVRNVVVNK